MIWLIQYLYQKKFYLKYGLTYFTSKLEKIWIDTKLLLFKIYQYIISIDFYFFKRVMYLKYRLTLIFYIKSEKLIWNINWYKSIILLLYLKGVILQKSNKLIYFILNQKTYLKYKLTQKYYIIIILKKSDTPYLKEKLQKSNL